MARSLGLKPSQAEEPSRTRVSRQSLGATGERSRCGNASLPCGDASHCAGASLRFLRIALSPNRRPSLQATHLLSLRRLPLHRPRSIRLGRQLARLLWKNRPLLVPKFWPPNMWCLRSRSSRSSNRGQHLRAMNHRRGRLLRRESPNTNGNMNKAYPPKETTPWRMAGITPLGESTRPLREPINRLASTPPSQLVELISRLTPAVHRFRKASLMTKRPMCPRRCQSFRRELRSTIRNTTQQLWRSIGNASKQPTWFRYNRLHRCRLALAPIRPFLNCSRCSRVPHHRPLACGLFSR